MKQSNKKEEARNLRKKAEEIFKNKTKSAVPLSEFDTMKLIHELEVHQIELDMQNEELLNAKIEAIEAKEKYVELYDFAPSGHFSLSTEGQILECNHAGSKLFGKSRSELINRQFVLFVSNSSKVVFNDFLEIVCQSKTKESCEVRLMSDKNEACIILLSGLYIDSSNTFLLTAVDLSSQKQAIEELKSSKLFVEEIINAIPVRVFWKAKDLIYLGCNKAFANDAGFSDPDDIIGKDDFQMVWKDQAEQYRNDDLHVINSGLSKKNIEETQHTPEGNTITLLTNKIPLFDLEKNVCGVIGSYVDITHLKQVEDDLNNHRLNLEEIVAERTKDLNEKNKELDRYNQLFEGREFRIKELRDKIKELESRLENI